MVVLVDVRALVDPQQHHIRMAHLQSKMQRCVAIIDFRLVERANTGSLVESLPNRMQVATYHSLAQRSTVHGSRNGVV